MREVGSVGRTIIRQRILLIWWISQRGSGMEGDDVSPFRSRGISDFCLDRCAHVLLSCMAACHPLSETMGAETVSSHPLPKPWEVLTVPEHYPSALHGPNLCHRFFPILPQLSTCRILRSDPGLLRSFCNCQFLRATLSLYRSRFTQPERFLQNAAAH